jgi:hypothetical protein
VEEDDEEEEEEEEKEEEEPAACRRLSSAADTEPPLPPKVVGRAEAVAAAAAAAEGEDWYTPSKQPVGCRDSDPSSSGGGGGGGAAPPCGEPMPPSRSAIAVDASFSAHGVNAQRSDVLQGVAGYFECQFPNVEVDFGSSIGNQERHVSIMLVSSPLSLTLTPLQGAASRVV